MRTIQLGERLREWLLYNGPRSIYWKTYNHALCRDQNKDVLSDLQEMILQKSEADLTVFFADIKSELRAKAMKADAESEDQPVPQGWPEPTD